MYNKKMEIHDNSRIMSIGCKLKLQRNALITTQLVFIVQASAGHLHPYVFVDDFYISDKNVENYREINFFSENRCLFQDVQLVFSILEERFQLNETEKAIISNFLKEYQIDMNENEALYREQILRELSLHKEKMDQIFNCWFQNWPFKDKIFTGKTPEYTKAYLQKVCYELLEALEKASLINDSNIGFLKDKLQKLSEREIQSLRITLLRLSKLDLLVDTNYKMLVDVYPFVPKFCMARTKDVTIFGENDDSTRFWSYCNIGIEFQLMEMMFKNTPLIQLLYRASDARFNIGQELKQMNFYQFGEPRTHGVSDCFSMDKTKSVSNPEVFFQIQKLLPKENPYKNIKLTETKALHFSLASEELTLPEKKITYCFNPRTDYRLDTVITEFNDCIKQQDFEKVVEVLDQQLKNMRENFNFKEQRDDQAFLKELATVTFFLLRCYYFRRGGASIVQFMVRAEVLAYSFGAINLGDIRLGESSKHDKNIPFDIYALLVDDVDTYVEAFQKALLPQFEKIASLESESRNLKFQVGQL